MCTAAIRLGIAAAVLASLIAAGTPPALADTASAGGQRACTTPPVSTLAGRFCGLAVAFADEGGLAAADVFEGIRYGQAGRWQRPRPVPASWGLIKATGFGPVCPQPKVYGVYVAQSEDCLSLNVWTPTRSSVANLPVMVFIHGGSFTSGGGALPVYNGARLAAWGRAIVVTFNYRLGALGFLAGGSGADHLAGNYGFEDQQLALRWVRNNIVNFGGDPNKITVFGESAGAMSVGAHLVAPGSRTLFRSAIMQSNPYGIPFKTQSQAYGLRPIFDVADAVSACSGHIPCLETLPAEKIVKAQEDVQVALFGGILGGSFDIADILAWAPYVQKDGLITAQPSQAAITRPVIAGTNRDEGTLFVAELFNKLHLANGLSDQDYQDDVTSIFKDNKIFIDNKKAIFALSRYKPDGKGNFSPLSDLIGDYFFSCATRHVLDDAKGARFGYAFDHPPSYPVWPQAPAQCQPGPPPNQGKVCHAFELPFVFRNPVTLSLPVGGYHFTAAEQTRLVDAISAYWTSFAATGDPNTGTATPPAWLSFGAPGSRQVLNLKISRTQDRALNCGVWDLIGYGPRAASLY